MKYEGYEEFFSEVGNECVRTWRFAEVQSVFTIEEMYEHFKARLLAEMQAGAALEKPGQ